MADAVSIRAGSRPPRHWGSFCAVGYPDLSAVIGRPSIRQSGLAHSVPALGGSCRALGLYSAQAEGVPVVLRLKEQGKAARTVSCRERCVWRAGPGGRGLDRCNHRHLLGGLFYRMAIAAIGVVVSLGFLREPTHRDPNLGRSRRAAPARPGSALAGVEEVFGRNVGYAVVAPSVGDCAVIRPLRDSGWRWRGRRAARRGCPQIPADRC